MPRGSTSCRSRWAAPSRTTASATSASTRPRRTRTTSRTPRCPATPPCPVGHGRTRTAAGPPGRRTSRRRPRTTRPSSGRASRSRPSAAPRSTGSSVSFNAKVTTAAAACQVKAEVSWNNGTTWNNASPALTTATLTTANNVNYTLGSQASLAGWGNNHTWANGDFTNANFRVRLTYLKGASCGNLSLNTLLVTVYSHTTTSTTTTMTTHGVSDGATFLPSQGGLRRHPHQGRQRGERRRLLAGQQRRHGEREVRPAGLPLRDQPAVGRDRQGLRSRLLRHGLQRRRGLPGRRRPLDRGVGHARLDVLHALEREREARPAGRLGRDLHLRHPVRGPEGVRPGQQGAQRHRVGARWRHLGLRRLPQRVVDDPGYPGRRRDLRPPGPDDQDRPPHRGPRRERRREQEQRHQRREHVVDRGRRQRGRRSTATAG